MKIEVHIFFLHIFFDFIKAYSFTCIVFYNKGIKQKSEKMNKIVFIDVDEILWNYENKLPESAAIAIQQAHAIDELLKHLHASIEDTLAFGDAKIDIPMLEYCHVGVAMGSGGEEIKAMKW